MRRAPFWPLLESIAPTILYDLAITGAATADRYRSVDTPALVIDTDSNPKLHNDTLAVLKALPNGQHRTVTAVGVGRPAFSELMAVLSEYFAD
jgi:hypothetical protein